MLLFCQIHYSQYDSIGLDFSVSRTRFRLRKKPMNQWAPESEESEHAVSRPGDFEAEGDALSSEVGCRESRRTTAKNQTTTPAMGLSRSVFLRLLLNQRAHNKNTKRVVAVPQQQPWSEFGKEQLSWVRGQKLVCRKTSTSSHIEYKRRELFARKTITSCIERAVRENDFELL